MQAYINWLDSHIANVKVGESCSLACSKGRLQRTTTICTILRDTVLGLNDCSVFHAEIAQWIEQPYIQRAILDGVGSNPTLCSIMRLQLRWQSVCLFQTKGRLLETFQPLKKMVQGKQALEQQPSKEQAETTVWYRCELTM